MSAAGKIGNVDFNEIVIVHFIVIFNDLYSFFLSTLQSLLEVNKISTIILTEVKPKIWITIFCRHSHSSTKGCCPGFKGSTCSDFDCFPHYGGCSNCTCRGPNICVCDRGWSVPLCDEEIGSSWLFFFILFLLPLFIILFLLLFSFILAPLLLPPPSLFSSSSSTSSSSSSFWSSSSF